MADLATFYRVLLAICGGLATLWGTFKIFNEIGKPRKVLESKVESIGRDMENMQKEMKKTQEKSREFDEKLLKSIENLDVKIDNMAAVIKEDNKSFSVLSAKSLLAIGNHLISGNDVHKIREANDNLVEYLMEK